MLAHPDEVPVGYPRDFERALLLHDGRAVFIRPVVPGDRDELEQAIRSADAQTLQRRFLGGPPPLTDEVLNRLTTLDYQHRFALAAADASNGRGVAIARYEPLGDGIAEVAVAVDPGWRRAGLATVLVEMLADAAVNRNIHTFSAMYLSDNVPVPALLAHAESAGRQRIKYGIAEAAVGLDRERIATALRDLDER